MSAIGRRGICAWCRISATCRPETGHEALAIVGASQKRYFEAYLNQMHDVGFVDAEAVLR
ncbi:hypothetical protein [Sphingomonas sp.]|uniref:hypothetical protein n=1 Tax=Sphingomonas sp. TaxID=28214 RepID=UPI0025DBD118|nr:hypothetical protein [Sphingomonas sp.]